MKRRFNIKRKISKFMAAALLVNTLAFNVGVLDVKAQNAGNVINLESGLRLRLLNKTMVRL